MIGLTNGCNLSVSAYPVAWKIEVIDDEIYHASFEYVRFEHTIDFPPEWLTDAAH